MCSSTFDLKNLHVRFSVQITECSLDVNSASVIAVNAQIGLKPGA
jgi:hypothetical protein